MRKLVAAIIGALAILPLAAEVKLADGGKTAYTIVISDDANKMEQAAAGDLALYLKKVTGAEFRVADAAPSPRLVIGKRAPSDKRPLRRRERRVVSENGDIYFYGDGHNGNAFAVYDFLDDIIGCRWFSLWGDEYVPNKPKLTLADLNYSRIPSFDAYEAGSYVSILMKHPGVRAFMRRNRIYFQISKAGRPDVSAYGLLDYGHHGLAAYLPPGGLKVGEYKHNCRGPLPYFAGREYFKTNPEYFSLINGKRVPYKHFCFSNSGFRREIAKNIRILLNDRYRAGSYPMIDLSSSDTGGPFCQCRECRALEKKYGTPGGAYFDWINEIATELKKDYPELVIRAFAYKKEMSEIPPAGLHFPDNVMINYAPLYNDYAQPLEAPSNASFYKTITSWSEHCSQMSYWIYPNPYALSSYGAPLLAGVRRNVMNLRLAHKLNVRLITAQFGAAYHTAIGFTELLLYLHARLCNDITRDADQLVREFCSNYYGAAAPLMLEYIADLERLTKAETHYVWCTPDQRILTYLTPENLRRWQKLFDKMEALTRNDPRRNLNVRRARLNLDTTMILRYPALKRSNPARADAEIDAAYKRHIATTYDDYIDMFSAIGKTERDWRQIRPSWRRLLAGVDVFYAEAKGGKPLPADFKPKGEAVFSIHPDRCMSWPERDANGAFGLGIPVSEKSAVVLEHRDNDCERIVLRRPFISKKQLAALGSEYELVYIGRGTLSYDALVKVMRAKPHRIDFFLGHLFDPEDPRRNFDFYLSVRRGEKGDLLIDRLVAVKLPKKSGKSGRRSSRRK